MDVIRNATLGIAIVAAGCCQCPARATPDIRYVQLNGSGMCAQHPDHRHQGAPRATGFRRTTNAFVICNFTSLPGYDGSVNYGDPQVVALILYSIDGNDHDVTCTGVTSVQGFEHWRQSAAVRQQNLTVNNTLPYQAAGVAFKLPAGSAAPTNPGRCLVFRDVPVAAERGDQCRGSCRAKRNRELVSASGRCG